MSKKIKWPKNGTYVKVVFLDHSIEEGDTGTLFKCTAVGEVTRRDRQTLVLRHWACEGKTGNDEFISLVRKAILEIKELVEKEEIIQDGTTK